MRIALEWIVTVLIALIVIVSMLLACLVYPFIWLSTKSRPPAMHKSPMTAQARAAGPILALLAPRLLGWKHRMRNYLARGKASQRPS